MPARRPAPSVELLRPLLGLGVLLLLLRRQEPHWD